MTTFRPFGPAAVPAAATVLLLSAAWAMPVAGQAIGERATPAGLGGPVAPPGLVDPIPPPFGQVRPRVSPSARPCNRR
ncbi:hypothetical protein [Sphingomonas sp. PAMC 26605]|uniref:hypothetical protein n=1 Tax=Sphingomonas sp. PAMC 26605 TaxID=1112214 RepID=UPI0012F49D8C|nr:hypothetical protein [Sphingomonas sp. PAMC 26605]